MIKTFTLEHFNRLEPYEVHLNRAVNGRYVYALTRPVFNELSAVYKELGYTQRLAYDCSSCLLNLCTTLANYYFPFKKQMEEKEEQSTTTDSMPIQGVENTDTEAETKPVEQPSATKKTNASKAKKTNTRKKK